MSRTTQEWEALLEGATPGPWVWIDEPDDADTQYIIDWVTGGMCLSLDTIGSGSAYKPSDPVLAAVAPEAVAEVVRLRRELEELLEVCDKVKDMRPSDDYEHGQYAGILQVGNTIANILNQEGK